jgi:hypothetical protein
MFRLLGCCCSVEEPDESAFLWFDQRSRKLSFRLGLWIEDGFAGSRDKKQYHTRSVDHT